MRVLVVDDEIKNAELTALALRDAGHDVAFVNGGAPPLRLLEAGPFEAVITDLRMPAPDGLALLGEARRRWPHTRVVLMTAYATLESARTALKQGAYDYVDKEGQFREELREIVARAEREIRLVAEKTRLEGTVESLKKGLATVIGEAPALARAVSLAERVAATDSTVLLRGESGTGKDLFARAIHFSSPRAAGPWVKVNCGALPENLLESELFGHEKGAFTGAVARKIGRFERASGGTLFLDEIGDMSLALQSKILRAVQEREIERVGGGEPIPVDVRLIAATHRDLKALISQDRFREDLYYRLAVVTIRLPPLADRGDDLLLLVSAFLHEFGRRHGKAFSGVTDRAIEQLQRHEWVGNVRELRNVIERAALLAEGPVLRSDHLPEEWRTSGDVHPAPDANPLASLQEVEARHIARVLMHTRGHIGEAARILGVHRNTLARKVREYRL